MLFGKKKNILSPVNGQFVPLQEVSDPVFAQEMMGDGVAVLPYEGDIVSPVEGTVSMIAEQKHGIGITMTDGNELLIHMGIDTVELSGEPFELMVSLNDRVKPGDPLAFMDIEKVRSQGKDPVIMLISMNKTLEKKMYNQKQTVSSLEKLAKIG